MTGLLLLAAGLIFHPVDPCRVVDTRVVSLITCHPDNGGICTHQVASVWGFLVAGDGTRMGFKDRGFDSEFPFSFEHQGGEAEGCGIPRDAKAVTLNLAVSSIHTGLGHARLWPFGITGFLFTNGEFQIHEPLVKAGFFDVDIFLEAIPKPLVKGAIQIGSIPVPTLPPAASVLNWPSNHCAPRPSGSHCMPGSENWYTNNVTVGICDPETAFDGDCNEDLLIKPYGGAVRVIVDVYGYYSEN